MEETSSPKILFVDDEADVELLMKQRFRQQLREKKFAFYFAQNGVQALEVLAKEPDIHMVVSDINMPEMDGLTLLRNVSEKYPSVIPIIVSAYGDMNNIRTAMNLGAFDFVTKPINFGDLTITIEKTLSHVQNLLASKQTKTRLDSILKELDVATHIQQSILPKVFIDNTEMQLYAKMIAAQQVGGDFYDFFWLDTDKTKLAFTIADVSGKGVPAALFMTVCRTLVRAHARATLSPDETIKLVNQFLEKDNTNMMFVTLFYGVLDVKTGVIHYINAGHNPPYIIRSQGAVEIIPSTHDMALGISDTSTYTLKECKLNPNDTLFLFTDGVTEATNPEQEYYTDKRLVLTLDEYRALTATELINSMEVDIAQFAAGYPQSDDITMLAIHYSGEGK
jgi:sigma-B regulation protein RsbU (phosphoserine phosphatase)